MIPREPRLRIRVGPGIVYDVRLDRLLTIEAYHTGRAPVFACGFTVEIVEGRRGDTVIMSRQYGPDDFPRFDSANDG